MPPGRTPFGSRGPLLAALLLLAGLSPVAGPRLRAAEAAARPETSLQAVPDDAAFYFALLRNREQVEAVTQSKAWARLMALPAVSLARAEWDKPGSDWAKFKAVADQPEVRDVIDLLAEMASDEIFLYGDQRWAGLAQLYGQMFGYSRSMLSAMMKTGAFEKGALGKGADSQKAGQKVLLHILKENLNLIQVPDLVIGFKVRKKERAEAQLQRLEKLLTDLIAREKPELKGRLQRKQVAGGEFLTFTVHGKEMGWEKSLRDIEENPGDADAVVKKLNGLTFTYTIGIRGHYVLAAVGESTAAVGRLGQGKRLIDRPELKPLTRFLDQRLTSIGYVSKALRGATTFGKKDVDGWLDMLDEGLAGSQLPADLQARIRKDARDLGKDVKTFIAEPGATLSFTFLSGRGYEGYEYDWSEHPWTDGSKPLTLLRHVGGSPLIAVVGRSTSRARYYDFLVKWVKVLNGYFEDFAVPQMQPADRAKYDQFIKEFHPLVRRFDQATGKMLLPALADGQTAFVLDAKRTSKQWHKLVPPTEKPLPLPELALVLGVSDADLLRKACGEYRGLINQIIDHAREAQPQVPNYQIPPPQVRKLAAGQMYFYPLPEEWGLDPQLLPNAGLSADVAVLTLSESHTERLLTRTPLKVKDGPLADLKRPLAGAVYVDWPGLVDALAPWVELAVRVGVARQKPAGKAQDPPPAKDEGKPAAKGPSAEEILKQVRTVVEVLKVLRGYTSCTYFEDGALVTHSETVIQDLEEARQPESPKD
jgi:hypothetical protein